MKYQYIKYIVSISLIAVLFSFGRVTGEDVIHGYPEAYKNADAVLGALLYDKWYTVKETQPKDVHPLYPATGKKQGATSWRCKECHGWDYIGKDGRYSKGSHFTGIKGIYDARIKGPEELCKLLLDKDANHDFSKQMSAYDLWSVVKFIREGLVDMRESIKPDGSAEGESAVGALLYQDNCAECHKKDGSGIDFKSADGVQGVGWLARDNPQETLHKIRWGHPGSGMPSGVSDKGLSDIEVVDILSYTQTLKY